MIQVGVISDTHNHLPPRIRDDFREMDRICHAGDIGDGGILETLANIAPTHAVYGNTDRLPLTAVLSLQLVLELENLKIMIQHNIGKMDQFYQNLKNEYQQSMPDIVIFGHTHRTLFHKMGDTYFINPGSASQPRGDQTPTALTLSLHNRRMVEYEILYLK